jgi:hypothetical protein
MRKLFAVTVVAVLMLVAVIATAQNILPQNSSVSNTTYTVQKGDKLYILEGAYSSRPWEWKRLVKLNPFLNEKGRIWVDEKTGKIIVLIRPGEVLFGLGKSNILLEPLPLSRLKIATPVPVSPVSPAKSGGLLNWLLLLVAIVLLCAFIAYTRMKKNPITAGPSMCQNGVTDQTVAQQFRINRVWPEIVPPSHYIEIKSIEKGLLFGLVRVKYGDNSSRYMILSGEIGYRALVRQGDDDPWNEEFMLQGCGNDLRAGTRYILGIGFRFIPTAPVVEKTPQPAATASSPSLTATNVVIPSSRETDDGEKYFIFRPANGSLQNLVQFKGFKTFEFEEVRGQVSIRFK